LRPLPSGEQGDHGEELFRASWRRGEGSEELVPARRGVVGAAALPLSRVPGKIPIPAEARAPDALEQGDHGWPVLLPRPFVDERLGRRGALGAVHAARTSSSMAAAAANKRSSSKCGPRSCTPTGSSGEESPASSTLTRPQGTEIPGRPARLAGSV